MSKYKEIAKSIEEKITNGLYDDTGKLPTEDVLIQEYQSSRNTIRNAINHLMRLGLVVSIQGSGVFLRKGDSEGAINLENFHGLTTQFKNKSVTTKVISFELKKGSEILLNLISNRINIGSMIITTNLLFDRWEEIFKDPILTTALVDRLAYKSHLINMSGDSYRIEETMDWLKEKSSPRK